MPAKIIDFTAPHKRKTESEIEISKVEKMALDKKMSYGKYVAMIEEEKKKEYTGNFGWWAGGAESPRAGRVFKASYMRSTSSRDGRLKEMHWPVAMGRSGP